MTKSILLVGVGGQGTILASKLLTLGLMEAGYDIKMSEIHGMSQRGGSVSSQVRYSKEKVYSPVIEIGGADMIVSFEKMEALRYLKYNIPVLISDQFINRNILSDRRLVFQIHFFVLVLIKRCLCQGVGLDIFITIRIIYHYARLDGILHLQRGSICLFLNSIQCIDIPDLHHICFHFIFKCIDTVKILTVIASGIRLHRIL